MSSNVLLFSSKAFDIVSRSKFHGHWPSNGEDTQEVVAESAPPPPVLPYSEEPGLFRVK